MTARLKGLYILDRESFRLIYGETEQEEIARLVDVIGPVQTRETIQANLQLLHDAEVLFSGWGMPRLDEEFLRHAPNLKAVFYGAGSIRYFTTDAFWQRGIAITSAFAANAEPVAQYTVGAVLLSLKHFWRLSTATRAGLDWYDPSRQQVPGGFRSTIGLISCGVIARRTLELLRPYELSRVIYCPFLNEVDAGALEVQRCSLPQVFRTADVVSLHTPELPETRGLIRGQHFELMKPGATFINTARGAVVNEPEMVDVLRRRPDLTAVLDVTDPEPPPASSPLLALPNVVLTPHIAGSLGNECQRMGRLMVEELRRFLQGMPMRWEIRQSQALHMA